MTIGGCGACICKSCLGYRAGTCPRGGCYDEWRAEHEPWPGEVRRSWSDWDKPGEQAHWCRGGVCYEAEACEDFVRYDPERHVVETCFGQNVERFQDGTIKCGLVDLIGCERCIEVYGKGILDEE